MSGYLAGIITSSDPAIRRAACEVTDFFVDVQYEGEIVRARYSIGMPASGSAQGEAWEKHGEPGSSAAGVLTLHEGGDSFITLPAAAFTKQQISPTRDSRLRWMQSVLHCTHYVAGAGEKAYLRQEEAPDITFVSRDTIYRSDEAYTEIPT